VPPDPAVTTPVVPPALAELVLARGAPGTVRRKALLRSGLRFRQTFPVAGRATHVLRLGARRLAGASGPVAAGDSTSHLRLSKAGRRAVRARRRATLAVVTTFVADDGRRASVTTPVTLR
jgi:hypothetical protein